VSTHPESHMPRSLYDCASVSLTPTGPEMRLVIATQVGASADPAVGTLRDGVVYELFVSTLPSPAFTASDILDLYEALVARLRRCWPMKMRSNTQIAGTRTRCGARSLPKS
jgi:hypothetical protein